MKTDLESAGHQLEATLLEAEKLAADCDDAQWQWTPAAAVWSAGGCIAHLNQVNRAYATAIRLVLEGGNLQQSAAMEFRYGLLERWFVKSMEPPVKMRLPAPTLFIPRRVDTREAAMSEWQRIHFELASLIQRSEPLHLSRVKVVSPANRFIKLSLGMAFALIAAHNRRHLWQARKMISAANSAAASL